MKSYQCLPVMPALIAAVMGCSSVRTGTNDVKAMAVEPAADAGFIQHPELQSKHADLPFQKIRITAIT